MWEVKGATDTFNFQMIRSKIFSPFFLAWLGILTGAHWLSVKMIFFHNGKWERIPVSKSHALHASDTSHEYFNKPQTSHIIHLTVFLPLLCHPSLLQWIGHGVAPFASHPRKLHPWLLSAFLITLDRSMSMWLSLSFTLKFLQGCQILTLPAVSCTTTVWDKRK